MKNVYVVTEICDNEYGCRAIESIWSSPEAAEAHIKELGGRSEFALWSGRMVDKYDVEVWPIQD